MLDSAQASLVTRLSLHVKDKTTNKTFDYEEAVTASADHGASSVTRFRVPATMTLPSATLHVEVDALDVHDNQLAVAEERVTVRPTPIAESHTIKKDELWHRGGFWSTAWP